MLQAAHDARSQSAMMPIRCLGPSSHVKLVMLMSRCSTRPRDMPIYMHNGRLCVAFPPVSYPAPWARNGLVPVPPVPDPEGQLVYKQLLSSF
jgi:hypothetical protein